MGACWNTAGIHKGEEVDKREVRNEYARLISGAGLFVLVVHEHEAWRGQGSWEYRMFVQVNGRLKNGFVRKGG
ncbi:conserved hypothetical protein [Bacillus sp. 349Y]|nr:conserved hypothetical protein [Bacillus sp. 349Y]